MLSENTENHLLSNKSSLQQAEYTNIIKLYIFQKFIFSILHTIQLLMQFYYL